MLELRQLLVVDDDPACGLLLEEALADEAKITSTQSPKQALELVRLRRFDLVLTDLRMPEMNGLEFLDKCIEIQPGIPVVVMTGHASVNTVREALRRGAQDYIVKPLALEAELRPLVRRLLGSQDARPPVPTRQSDDLALVGSSAAFREAVAAARRAAMSEAPVLITGESGTGKEVFAQFVNALSGRRLEPFVSVNCAAIPENLIESEMFGHVRGAFTGASSDRVGYFEAADRGTIFLDEVGELPLPLQPKLLRVLQTGEYYRIGDDVRRIHAVDVRVIAATNLDLEQAVAQGRFRSDLYHRLNVLPLHLPPLRERPDDIPLLTRHFLTHFGASDATHFSATAEEALSRHPWPGNVRELANAVEQCLVYSPNTVEIPAEVLPARIRNAAPRRAPSPDSGTTLREVEEEQILLAMSNADFNQTQAAEKLGITRRQLYLRITKYDLWDRIRERRQSAAP